MSKTYRTKDDVTKRNSKRAERTYRQTERRAERDAETKRVLQDLGFRPMVNAQGEKVYA